MCTNPTPNSSTESAPVQPSVLPVQKSNDREQPIFISAIPFRLGSPFKIECLYKSSPIRERVLNARTSPLPRRKPSIHLSTLFPYNPFPGPFLLPFLLLISPPSPFILPPPPVFNRTLSARRIYHTFYAQRRSSFCVLYPSPRDQIKKKGGKREEKDEEEEEEEEKEGRRGLVCHHRLKGKGAWPARGEPARIYWTCLGEESRLVALATRRSPPPRKPIKSVDSPKRFWAPSSLLCVFPRASAVLPPPLSSFSSSFSSSSSFFTSPPSSDL